MDLPVRIKTAAVLIAVFAMLGATTPASGPGAY